MRAATAASLDAASASAPGAINAVMILSALSRLDEAFAVTDGYLLRRGSLTVPIRHGASSPSINEQRRRKTLMLFVPATAPLRADPRFDTLCRELGLEDYWRETRTRPDYRA